MTIRYPNRWIVLLAGLALSFVLLTAIDKESFVLQSVSVTFIAATAISYYLWRRYRKGLSPQADLFISSIILLQFIFPIFYLAWFYGAHPELDKHGYRYGYAMTSFASLLGLSMFFAGYESIKRGLTFRFDHKLNCNIRLLLVAFLPLLASAWIARFILLRNGTYYHAHYSSFQNTKYFSILSELSRCGLVPVVALFVAAFSEKQKKTKKKILVLAIITIALEFCWYIPAGKTGFTVATIGGPMFSYLYVNKRIPKRAIIFFTCSLVFFIIFLRPYRYYVSKTSDFQDNKINIEMIPEALSGVKDSLSTKTVTEVCDRLYDGRCLGYLLLNYKNDYTFQYGETYKSLPYILIPRALAPDKPVITILLNKYYKLMLAGGMPLTFWGECYINFSWAGIAILSFVLGFFMKIHDSIYIANSNNLCWITFYLFTAVWAAQIIPMHNLAMSVGFLCKNLILCFVFSILYSLLLKHKT